MATIADVTTAVNAYVKTAVDAAVAPLNTQIASLKASLAAAQTSVATYQAQLAAAATAQGDEELYWFKGDGSAWVFIYNPVTGTKRHLSSQEAALLRLLYGTTTWPVTTIPQATADAIPSA